MMKCKDEVKDRFIITYQNVTTGREHTVFADGKDVEAILEWHKARRNLVTVVPYEIYLEQRHV